MLDAGFTPLFHLKSRILPEAGVDDTQWDAALSALGRSVARRFEAHCNRHLERHTAASEIYSARTLAVSLKAYPVITLTSVQLRAADGTLATVAATYQLDKGCGLLDFSTPPGSAAERLLLTYDGGYWLDPMDGTTTLPTGATALPEDILELWLAEVQTQAEARELFGSVALRKEGKTPPAGLSAATTEGLRPYRRFSGE
jgi:hypothetical protein